MCAEAEKKFLSGKVSLPFFFSLFEPVSAGKGENEADLKLTAQREPSEAHAAARLDIVMLLDGGDVVRLTSP